MKMKPVRRFSFVNKFILFTCYLNTLSRLLLFLMMLLLTTTTTTTAAAAAVDAAAAVSTTAALASSTRSYNPCAAHSSIAAIRRVQFTNDTYTGYVSENLNLHQDSPPSPSPHDQNPDLDKWRRNVVVRRSGSTSSTRPVNYVRFVDRLKPSLRLQLTSAGGVVSSPPLCSCVSDDELNVTFVSADYDQQEQALELFQLDRESISCIEVTSEALAATTSAAEVAGVQDTECLCYFQMRLSDDPMVRDRLNREAKDVYKFQISIMNLTASINIQVFDKL